MEKNDSTIHNNSKTAIVIGAGIGGLFCAWKLCKNGYKVTVLEKQRVPGGLSSSIPLDGYKIDLGPHYLTFEKDSKITEEIISLIGESNLIKIDQIQNMYKSYFLGNIIDGFPTLNHVFLKHDKMVFLNAGSDFIFSKIKSIFSKTPKSGKNYLISIYGKFLYEKWCKPYILQNFGTENLSLEFVKDRFSPIPLKKAFNKILPSKNSNKINNDSKNVNSKKYLDYYVKNGMGFIIEKLCNEIVNFGGQILFNVNIDSINHDNSKKTIHFSSNDTKNQIDSNLIVYSVPLSIMYNWFPELPSVESKKQSNAFHSIMIFLCMNNFKLFDGWIMNIFDSELPYFRLAQQNYLSSTVAPKGKSILSVELRLDEENPIWAQDDSKIINTVIQSLDDKKIIDKKQIDIFKLIRLKNLYPKFEKANSDHKLLYNHVQNFPNEYILGTNEIDTGRLISDNPEIEDKSDYSIGGIYTALLRTNDLINQILKKTN
jgi:protoporphyrinogen oxidase